MKKIKAIWTYLVFGMLFPVWWLVVFGISLLISFLSYVINFEWEFKHISGEMGFSFDLLGLWKKVEKDLRLRIKDVFRER